MVLSRATWSDVDNDEGRTSASHGKDQRSRRGRRDRRRREDGRRTGRRESKKVGGFYRNVIAPVWARLRIGEVRREVVEDGLEFLPPLL